MSFFQITLYNFLLNLVHELVVGLPDQLLGQSRCSGNPNRQDDHHQIRNSESMESLHSNPSGRAQVHNQAASPLGHRNHLLCRLQPNGDPLNTMDLHVTSALQIPSASLSLFDTLKVILWVPSYERLLVLLTGYKFGFTQLQRIGVGLAISVLVMASAATPRALQADDSQGPPLLRAQARAHVGVLADPAVLRHRVRRGLHFREAARILLRAGLRRHAKPVLGTVVDHGGARNYLNSVLVKLVGELTSGGDGNGGWIPENLNYGRLDCFFWLLGLLSLINLGVYVMVARWYT